MHYYFKIICFITFLTHISFIGYYELFPMETSTRFSERKLDAIDFPILFKICINPAFDDEKLKQFGYSSLWYYFEGRSRWSNKKKRIYGWSGHIENGSTVSSVQGNITVYEYLESKYVEYLEL